MQRYIGRGWEGPESKSFSPYGVGYITFWVQMCLPTGSFPNPVLWGFMEASANRHGDQ